MKRPYRGETDSKKVARALVWWQHQRALGTSFRRTPHIFLASKVAGDADTLMAMKVSEDFIWAVEKEEAQYRPLLDRKPKFRVFTQKVETLIESRAKTDRIRSVYLDYCGNLEGEAKTTRRVIARLPEGSAVSITVLLARELKDPGDRENALLHQLQEHSQFKVTLLQSIRYMSSDDASYGSPMGTWTFAIGSPIASRSKMRFDIMPSQVDVSSLLATPAAIRALWQKEQTRSERQSLAAKKANQTRRR